MKTLTWVVGITVLAVALTMIARQNPGYVLLTLPPWRVELSLNFFLVLLAAGFIGGYALVRFVVATLDLPRQVREFRAARRRDAARAQLLEALHEYFAGRYSRAERAAARAIEAGEQADLCAVIAARAAHELRAYERRDGYLARAADAPDGDQTARIVTQAELLLDERRHQEALALLTRLPRRHTAALRLEMKARQQARSWEEVAELAEALRRRNVFDAEQAAQVRRYALAENLKRKALDSQALEAAWQKVPSADRAERRVAATAARCFIALGGCERAHRIIEQALETEWDTDLVALYAECEGGDAVARIERAEAWLKQHPGDAALLLTLGRLCAGRSLWGKAQSYLEASLAIEPTFSGHLAAGRLQESLGNAEAARRHYRESLELALAQLKQVTGGRRRVPI